MLIPFESLDLEPVFFSSSSSSSSSTMDAGEMLLCPHLLQLAIITYTYYLLKQINRLVGDSIKRT